MIVSREEVLAALRRVRHPDGTSDIVTAGLVSGVSVREGKVGFLVTIAPEDEARFAPLAEACEAAVKALPGVTSVTAVLTAETAPADMPPRAPEPARRAVWNREKLPHVARLLAVASGKGGVGKSTTTVQLAHAFTCLGQRVGVLDADIYGPSIPRLLGMTGAPEMQDNLIVPHVAHGIRCMSMGFLVGEDAALVWRGPQMSKALHQLLRGVAWGSREAPLDILLIDMPPGTGDAHLSLVQQAPVDAALIVTTPQEVAVQDARKCIDMFRKVSVPIAGVIENMSGFTGPDGQIHAIFGEGGGARLAAEAGMPLLGQVALYPALRAASDRGEIFPGNGQAYGPIAERLLKESAA